MKLSINKKVVAIFTAFVFAFSALALPVTPANAQIDAGVTAAQGSSTSPDLFGQNGIFTTVVNLLLFIIGAISVIMLIWGGIRYTTSGGNSASVTAAKNTILYAIIGLVVAFLAFAIVNWVLDGLQGKL